MGFRTTVVLLLFLILADAIFTIVRPTTADYSQTMNVDVLDYVLVAAHAVATICQVVAIFALFSSTVWFTAGLLGELFLTAKWTMLIWFLRFIFVVVPWVHKRFIADLGDRAMEDRDYRFLYVSDLLLAVSSWAALMFTASCMTEKRMFAPYHKEMINLPAVAFSNQNVNSFMMPSGGNTNNNNIQQQQQAVAAHNLQSSNSGTTMMMSNSQPPLENTATNTNNTNLGYDHASFAAAGGQGGNDNGATNTSAPPPGVE